MPVSRIGVSLEEDLLEALDEYVKTNQFPNRSQAIRHLIEKNLVERKWQCNHIVAGAIVLHYDHHRRELTNKLGDIQHDYFEVILSNQHFHLDHDHCLEIIAVKGQANQLTELADKLISLKGIRHGKLMMSQSD
jgi:CopG family transcriptional regulator, nickel-responsive regulator